MPHSPNRRPLIAFFDAADVFEDFYPHYGVSQHAFATEWAATGNHAYASLLQREIGDVVWYESSIAPELDEACHGVTRCRVRIVPSSWLHRWLWRAFYLPRMAWRWQALYPAYAVAASYTSLLSSRFLRAILRDRPDVLFLQDYCSGRYDCLLLLGKWLGIPVIAYHSGSRPAEYAGKIAKYWTIRRADALVLSSRAEANMLASRYRVPADRLKVVLTPIDTVSFHPMDRDEACRLSGLDSASRWLLFVGRFDNRVKRVTNLIEAFASVAASHPDVKLAIVGDGPDRESVHEQARAAGSDRVRVLGWASGAHALAPLYNAAECLVLPSWSEGFPTVVGEAMACGTPVLASDVGGIPELVVDRQTGWLIPPGDGAILEERVQWVFDHAGFVRAMRPRVRETAVARVSSSAVAAALKDCFVAAGVHVA